MAKNQNTFEKQRREMEKKRKERLRRSRNDAEKRRNKQTNHTYSTHPQPAIVDLVRVAHTCSGTSACRVESNGKTRNTQVKATIGYTCASVIRGGM